MKGLSLVVAELALVEAAFESMTLMTVVAAVAELLTEEEAQEEAVEQPGTAAELLMTNQVKAAQVCLAADHLAPVV